MARPEPTSPAADRAGRRPALWLRVLKRFGLTLAASVSFLTLLVGAVLGLLSTEWGLNFVRHIATDAVSASIEGTLRVARMEGAPPWRLTLHDVRLEGPDGQLAARLDRVEAQLDPWRLLSQTVTLTEVEVTGLFFETLGDQGQVLIAQALQPVDPSSEPSDGPGWAVELDNLRIREGPDQPVRINLPGGGRLTDLSLGLRLSVGEELRWDDLEIDAVPHGLPFDRVKLRAAGALADGALVVDRLEADLSPHAISANGRFAFAEGADRELTLHQLLLDLPRLKQTIGYALKGTARLSGTLRGHAEDLSADLTLDSAMGAIDIGARLEGESWRVELQNTVDLLAPHLLIKGMPPVSATRLDAVASGTGDPIDPAAGGDAKAHFRLEGLQGSEGLPEHVRVSAEARAGNVKGRVAVFYPGSEVPDLRARVDGRVDDEWEARLSIRGVDVAEAAASIGLEQGHGAYIDRIRARLVTDGAFAPKHFRARGRVAHALAPLPQPLSRLESQLLTFQADLAFDQGKPFGPITLEAEGMALGESLVDTLELQAELITEDSGARVRSLLRMTGLEGALPAVEGAESTRIDAQRLGLSSDLLIGTDGALRADIELALEGWGMPVAPMSAERISLPGTLNVSPSGEVKVAGSLGVSRFLIPGAIDLANARGPVDVRVSAAGAVDIESRLEVETLVAGGVTSATQARVDVRTQIDERGEVRIRGDTVAQAVDVAGALDVGRADMNLDLRIAGNAAFPEGAILLDAAGVSLTANPELVSGGGLRATVALRKDASIHVVGLGSGASEVRAMDLEVVLPDGRGRTGLAVHIDRLELFDGPIATSIVDAPTVRLGVDGKLSTRGLRALVRGGQGGALSVGGHLQLADGTLDARVGLDSFDVGPWLSWLRLTPRGFPLEGQLDAAVQASGSASAPMVDARVKLSNGRAGPLRGMSALLLGGVLNGRIGTRGDIRWQGGEGKVSIDADIPLRRRVGTEQSGHIRLALQELDLSAFRDLVPRPDESSALFGTAEALWVFELIDGEPRGELSVDVQELAYGPVRAGRLVINAEADEVEATGSVSLTSRGQQLLFVQLESLARLLGPLWATETMSTLEEELSKKPSRVKIKMTPTRLSSLPFLSRNVSQRVGAAVVGIDAELLGTLERVELSGQVEARALPIGPREADAVLRMRTDGDDIVATLSGDAIERSLLDGQLRIPSGLRGRLFDLGFMRDPRFVAWLSVGSLTPEDLRNLVPDSSQLVSGIHPDAQLTAQVVAKGAAEGPSATVHADLVARKVRARSRLELPLADSVRVAAHLGPAQTRVHMLVEQGRQGRGMMLEGALDLGSVKLLEGEITGEEQLALNLAVSRLRLAGLSRLLPSVFGPSSGELTGEIVADGPLRQPNFDGLLIARFDEVTFAAAGITEKDLRLELELVGRALRMRPIRLTDGDGLLEIRFAVALPNLNPEEMLLSGGITLDRFRVMRRTDMSVKASGNISLAGSIAKPEIKATGEKDRITLERGFLAPSFGGSVASLDPPEDVVYVTRSGTILREDEESRAIETGADINIEVMIPRRSLHIRNQFVDAYPRGQIFVKTARGKLGMTGIIKFDDSKVILYGRSFEITDTSSVMLRGRSPIDPDIDVTAEYDISFTDLSSIGLETTKESRIFVRVSGRASNFDLDLTSDPPMDEPNIVSVIISGAPQGVGETETDAVQAQVGNLLVGLITGSLVDRLATELPFDAFGFDPSSGALSIGKRLSKDSLVIFRSNFEADEGDNAFEWIYRQTLTERWSLDMTIGDAGAGSAEAVWRVDLGGKPAAATKTKPPKPTPKKKRQARDQPEEGDKPAEGDAPDGAPEPREQDEPPAQDEPRGRDQPQGR